MTMKKYNSIYKVMFTIDHDMEDGSDVTYEMMFDRLTPVAGVATDLVFEGPHDTIENE